MLTGFTSEVLGVKKLGGHDVDLDMLAGEVEHEVLGRPESGEGDA